MNEAPALALTELVIKFRETRLTYMHQLGNNLREYIIKC